MGLFSIFFKKKPRTERLNIKDKLAFLEVDMHNHLLPGIDDGSQSVEQSLELIDGLQQLGYSKFICTPHIMDGVHNNDHRTIGGALRRLQFAMKNNEQAPELYGAAEHMIDTGIAKMVAEDTLCRMPGDYVLIEMSYLQESQALFQTIFNIQSMGYKPILAHPERYTYYHHSLETYKKIKDAGCALQLNLLSVSRYYGTGVKEAALDLVKKGMYDFVGTDLHHAKHLAALQDVVAKYDIRAVLKKCTIKNQSLVDHMGPNLRMQVI